MQTDYESKSKTTIDAKITMIMFLQINEFDAKITTTVIFQVKKYTNLKTSVAKHTKES